ncbi:hypothetical protein P8452_59723 [Trifolium repens]|nr:hypothetical protein P8452_59723 [Trifolium repens]
MTKLPIREMTQLRMLDLSNSGIEVIPSNIFSSLTKLEELYLGNISIKCDSLQEIIMGKENVDIAFVSLQILILKGLPSLNNFCSSKCCLKFPLLERVVVSKCNSMEMFSKGNTSTPSLRKVRIEENGEEWTWKGNLNDTIKKCLKISPCHKKRSGPGLICGGVKYLKVPRLCYLLRQG